VAKEKSYSYCASSQGRAFLGERSFWIGRENVEGGVVGVLFELCIARFFWIDGGLVGSYLTIYHSDWMYAFLLVVDIGSYQYKGLRKRSIASYSFIARTT
jgi:hypothetical protein